MQPAEPSHRNIISGGSTGIVELLPSGHVLKSPYPGDDADRAQSLRELQREFDVYQRLPRGHARLIRAVAFSPERGLTLEYMPNGNLRDWLRSDGVSMHRRLQWACDAAEGVHLLHAHGVVHCDVSPSNFLLDAALRLRIIDFSGSSIDGSWSSAFESARFCLPRSWEAPSTVPSDLFALGSTMYEIVTGLAPYEDLADEEVELLFRKRQFPAVDGVPAGGVILGCWLCEFGSALDVWTAMKAQVESSALT
jgi:serine/threonine protein kinase